MNKVGIPRSLRLLTSGDSYRDAEPATNLLLVLRCEVDYDHYAKRTAPPGPVHPATDASIRRRRGWTDPPQG